MHSNEGAWASFPLPVRLDTFPELFARHGWRTASIGKSHVPRGYRPWQEERHDGSSMHEFGLDRDPASRAPIVPDGIPSPVGGVFPDREFFPPEAVTINAIDWLDRIDDTPFLLRVSYLQPHTPVLPPGRYRSCFVPRTFPATTSPRHNRAPTRMHSPKWSAAAGSRMNKLQRAQADYHALVTWLDARSGLLLAKLDLMGLRDRTIMVFDSDHGASLGENGLLSKVVFAPQSHRVPRIVSWPGTLPAAAVRDDLAPEPRSRPHPLPSRGPFAAEHFRGRALFSDPPPDAIFASVGQRNAGRARLGRRQQGIWRNRRRVAAAWLHPHRSLAAGHELADGRRRGSAGEEGRVPGRWRAIPSSASMPRTDRAHDDIKAALVTRLAALAPRRSSRSFVRSSRRTSREFAPPRMAKI